MKRPSKQFGAASHGEPGTVEHLDWGFTRMKSGIVASCRSPLRWMPRLLPRLSAPRLASRPPGPSRTQEAACATSSSVRSAVLLAAVGTRL